MEGKKCLQIRISIKTMKFRTHFTQKVAYEGIRLITYLIKSGKRNSQYANFHQNLIMG